MSALMCFRFAPSHGSATQGMRVRLERPTLSGERGLHRDRCRIRIRLGHCMCAPPAIHPLYSPTPLAIHPLYSPTPLAIHPLYCQRCVPDAPQPSVNTRRKGSLIICPRIQEYLQGGPINIERGSTTQVPYRAVGAAIILAGANLLIIWPSSSLCFLQGVPIHGGYDQYG